MNELARGVKKFEYGMCLNSNGASGTTPLCAWPAWVLVAKVRAKSQFEFSFGLGGRVPVTGSVWFTFCSNKISSFEAFEVVCFVLLSG